MASNPLVQAVEHFSLAQLMADTNLCRNVLNDIGAAPAEIFVLVAALEARIPQTLLEHSATNDLSVVEPRLIAELNERGLLDDVSMQGALDAAPPDFAASTYAYLVSDLARDVTGQIFIAAGGFVGRFDRAAPSIVAYRDHHDSPPWSIAELDGFIQKR